jgi:hypothetical protein
MISENEIRDLSPKEIKELDKTLFNRHWRMDNIYHIQTKDSRLMQFKLNPVQQVVDQQTEGHQRIMQLKSRQVGMSTYWLLRELDDVMWTPHTTCAVLAHDLATLNLLFEIVKRAYDNIPEIELPNGQRWVKPFADRDTTRMLKFNEMDSKIYVDLEVRGGTIHRLHISESAFVKDMNLVWAATQESVPVKGGRIVVETTANGKGNWFNQEWEKDPSVWKKLFFAWFDHPDNYMDVPFKGNLTRYSQEHIKRTITPEETKMKMEYELNLGQIAWYRFKMDSYPDGDKHLMKQENPSNPEEAFIYAEGRFYPEFSRTLHVLPDHEPPPGVNKFVSLDYGWSNPSSIGLWYVDYDGNCIRYKEGYHRYWPIEEQCKWLKSHGFTTVDFGDPSIHAKNQQRMGKVESLADEYKRYGVLLKKANNDKGAGFPRMRDYLKLRNKHKNPLTGVSPAPTLYFCEGCTNSIREMETIRYAKPPGAGAMNQEAKEDHEKTEKVSHACDDIRYFIVSRPRTPTEEVDIPPNTPLDRMQRHNIGGGAKPDTTAY